MGVNKLFKLSEDPPFGVMIYNNAEFLNVPLETVIKEFSKIVAENDLSTLDEIKAEFESYLGSIVSKSQYKISFEDMLNSFIENLKDDLKYMSVFELEDILKEEMEYFDFTEFQVLFNQIYSQLDKNKDVFDNLVPGNLDPNQKDELIETFKEFFIFSFIENFNGIVIAGFERENLFPSYVHFRLFYLYDDEFVLEVFEEGSINGILVIIKPFAEDDVIDAFLTSIDSETQNAIVQFLETKQNYLFDLIMDRIANSKNLSESEKEHFLEEISVLKLDCEDLRYSFLDFINDLKNGEKESISRNIYHLPYGDLSNLAESLIKITSLKRRIQDDIESVGGPVDVAIITKGDGFKWIKNKNF